MWRQHQAHQTRFPILDNPLPYPGYEGRLLRLTVVGINSFKRDGAAANNPGAPDHVVFQFQNIPVFRQMNPTDTNLVGYAGSEMRTYLIGNFLTGLKNATGLTDAMLWAHTRYVPNQGQKATAAAPHRMGDVRPCRVFAAGV